MAHSYNKEYAPLIVVVPAAGVGKRMQASCPKQYLKINQRSILEHTVFRLLSHSDINKVIVVINADDEYFKETELAEHQDVLTVLGGQERVDSVLAGLNAVDTAIYPWVLVHDAARPCISHRDIDALVERCRVNNQGGLLAYPVKDTIKYANSDQLVGSTVDRSTLWHALTPQMYQTEQLIQAVKQAKKDAAVITDESSAIEHFGLPSLLVQGSSANIKITNPEDLALAKFYLTETI
ncbi:MAG: 2-C-methyl-D-erythritol 4-phosphate cytidylyltransferase [Colwellia sp.]|nr:2-C-methyl-D-erythritol 4-phosphate cytidylyltransferase [Colwellia sp.]